MADKVDDTKPEPQWLAEQYLDLWQEQFAAMAADPAFADLMARWFAQMGAAWLPPGTPMAGGAPFAGAPPKRDDDDTHGPSASRQPRTDAAPGGPAGAAPPGAAPVAGGGQLDELVRRVAALEERLDALESRARGARKKP